VNSLPEEVSQDRNTLLQEFIVAQTALEKENGLLHKFVSLLMDSVEATGNEISSLKKTTQVFCGTFGVSFVNIVAG